MQARKDAASGRTFFIDHNTRATTWDRPPTPTRGPSPPPNPDPSPSAPAPDAAHAAERNGYAGGAGDLQERAAPAEAGSAVEPAANGEPGGAQAPPRWGLFGLGVDEVRPRLAPSTVPMQLPACVWDLVLQQMSCNCAQLCTLTQSGRGTSGLLLCTTTSEQSSGRTVSRHITRGLRDREHNRVND